MNTVVFRFIRKTYNTQLLMIILLSKLNYSTEAEKIATQNMQSAKHKACSHQCHTSACPPNMTRCPQRCIENLMHQSDG